MKRKWSLLVGSTPALSHWSAIFTLAGTFLLFTVCSKEETEPAGPYDPIDNSEEVAGLQNIGSGYDVFDKFADEAKVREHILDFRKLNDAGLVEKKDLEMSSFIKTSGSSITEYASSLAVSAGLEGSYMFFSGSVESNFSRERYEYNSYSFATYHILTNKYHLRLPTDRDANDLKPYLTTTAKTKLNDPAVPAGEIFRVYGTHCLTGVVVGARADYSISGRTSDVKTGVSVGVYAEASFSKGYGSGSISTSVISESEFNTFASNMEQHLEVYGGNSELGNSIITKNDYDSWINSIPNKLVFCNYTQNGLIPVWEFCDDAARRAELEAAYATWATDRNITVHPKPRVCILDILILTGGGLANPYTNPANGRHYYKLNYDLNKNAGGDLIYIYYLPGLENDPIINTTAPVAEVRTVNTSNGETLGGLGAGFTLINKDLNAGAGGDFIYLAYRRRNDYTDKLITGLRVIKGTGSTNDAYSVGTAPSYTWYGVTRHNSAGLQDLNEGVGGDFIYMYYTDRSVDESALPGK